MLNLQSIFKFLLKYFENFLIYFFVFFFSFLFLSFSLHNITSCRRLRTELQIIRRKGAIKTSGGGGSLDRPNIETYQSCARCRSELGRIINRGAPCRSCRERVCKACREFSTRTTDWVCIVCHKQMWVIKSAAVCALSTGIWHRLVTITNYLRRFNSMFYEVFYVLGIGS